MKNFELFVARRYLRAKRKTAVISIITVISIIGVAAGVMALVIALAINNGFRDTLQRNLLGATAHINVLEKVPGAGIENYRALTARLRQTPHVIAAAPVLYGQVYLTGPQQASGAVIKGVDIQSEMQAADVLRHLKQGSIERLDKPGGRYPGIILGARLAQSTGMLLDSVVTVIIPQGEVYATGIRPSFRPFRVVGIFETGFFELDNAWAYIALSEAQRSFSLGDVVNSIELKVDDVDRAAEIAKQVEPVIGDKMVATSWKETNRSIMNALRMEKAVSVITIGLIQLVAALNILITLIMMVMEKHKDIAILMSMGARRQQIRNIFMLQGVLIGVVGTAIGLMLGYGLSFLANHYHWIRLDEEVYSLSFVPFDPRPWDGVWVAVVAVLVSFVATIYPARSATRIVPVETIRYE